MRDYLKEYGITPYINAHDTITLYGASRMAQNTKRSDGPDIALFCGHCGTTVCSGGSNCGSDTQ